MFYAYVSSHGRKVSVLRMEPDSGAMTRIQEVSIREGAVPPGVREIRLQAMALSPDNRFLYVANRTEPFSIHTFAIDARDGTLTHLLESPTADSTNYMSTDRSGRLLLAAHNPPDHDRRDGFVSVAAISEQGMALAPHQVIHTPPKTHSILPDPSNRFVLATVCDGDKVMRYALDAACGTLNPDGLTPLYLRPKAGPRHHRYHPNGRFLYVNNEYDGTLYCYRYDAATGSTAEIQIVQTVPSGKGSEEDVRASELRLTPDGKWLYAGVRSTSSIHIFAIDAMTGRLTPAGACEVPRDPRGYNIDPFGRFLLHSAHRSDCVIAYRIDAATGALAKAAELPLDGPNYVEIVRLP